MKAEWRVCARVNQLSLVGAKPLSDPMLKYCYWNLRKNLRKKICEILSEIPIFFTRENAFEAEILLRPQCVEYFCHNLIAGLNHLRK